MRRLKERIVALGCAGLMLGGCVSTPAIVSDEQLANMSAEALCMRWENPNLSSSERERAHRERLSRPAAGAISCAKHYEIAEKVRSAPKPKTYIYCQTWGTMTFCN